MSDSDAVVDGLTAADYLLLGVPCAWASLNILARNPVGIPHAERLLLVSLLLWVMAVLAARVMVGRGWNRKPVVYTTFMTFATLLVGGGVLRQSGPLVGWLLLILLVVITGLISARMGRSILPDVLIVAIATALASGPAIDAIRSWGELGSNEMEDLESVQIEIEGDHDVYLIVLDGFPGIESMDTTFGSERGSLLEASLEDEGLIVPEMVRASYPVTNYSVPSILEMGYPVREEPDDLSTLQGLYDIISGDDRVREVFSANGYDTYMVEAGWSGSSCRHWYDHCIPSSWFDDPMYQVVRDSVFYDLVPGTAYQYGVGSKATMNWLMENLPGLSRDGKPSFVFAHVLAPHAPLFLTSDCELDPDADRGGFFFRRPGVPDETRNEYLDQQIECVSDFLLRLVGEVDESAELVFTSDHGTDRRDQTARDPAGWTAEDTAERMNAFIAARLSEGCSLDDGIYLPNLMRRVISCLSPGSLPDVESRTYLILRDWTRG